MMSYITREELIENIQNLTSSKNFVFEEVFEEAKAKILDMLSIPETHIECPHCCGTGVVDEGFLTDEFVSEVFSDWCTTGFHYHAYGVERWEEYLNCVSIKQDISSRGCYDNKTHSLPKKYFTRNKDKRLLLMKEDYDKKIEEDSRENLRKLKAKVQAAEEQAKTLRELLDKM